MEPIYKKYKWDHLDCFHLSVEEGDKIKDIDSYAIENKLIPSNANVYERGWGGGQSYYYAFGIKHEISIADQIIPTNNNKCPDCCSNLVNKTHYFECSNPSCYFRKILKV